MEALLCIAAAAFLLWLLEKFFSSPSKADEESDGIIKFTITAPPIQTAHRARGAYRSPAASGPPRRNFDLYADARTESGRFDAGHVSFSSSRLASKPPSIVTGLTFETDRIYVLRGQGMAIFPFGTALTVAVLNGRPAGFQEHVDYAMSLSYEGSEQASRFPLAFPGWLEIIDQARRSGASIEMDDDLPEPLKELITHPLPGDEHHDPVRIRPASPAPSAGPVRCPSCGANLGGRQGCDFCGSRH